MFVNNNNINNAVVICFKFNLTFDRMMEVLEPAAKGTSLLNLDWRGDREYRVGVHDKTSSCSLLFDCTNTSTEGCSFSPVGW